MNLGREKGEARQDRIEAGRYIRNDCSNNPGKRGGGLKLGRYSFVKSDFGYIIDPIYRFARGLNVHVSKRQE